MTLIRNVLSILVFLFSIVVNVTAEELSLLPAGSYQKVITR